MFDFELGQYVKDELDGYQGIIDARAEWESGSLQYSVQPPPGDDGKVPDSMWRDPHFMEAVPEKSKAAPHGEPDWDFDIGSVVRCRHTPFEGTVIGRCQWINSCVKYWVVSASLFEGKPVKQWFDAIGLVLKEKPQPATAQQSMRRTGGPSSKSGFHL